MSPHHESRVGNDHVCSCLEYLDTKIFAGGDFLKPEASAANHSDVQREGSNWEHG
jgi:hypothetical protein